MSASSSATRTRASLIPNSYHGHTAISRGAATLPGVATILIADPDPGTWTLLELLVLRLGHRPIGQRELAEGEQPDLMLLEPSSRLGLRQAQGLRRRLPQLPVLCVSIDGPSTETRELNPVGHVMKPFRRIELERKIQQALMSVAPPQTSGCTA